MYFILCRDLAFNEFTYQHEIHIGTAIGFLKYVLPLCHAHAGLCVYLQSKADHSETSRRQSHPASNDFFAREVDECMGIKEHRFLFNSVSGTATEHTNMSCPQDYTVEGLGSNVE